MSDQTALLLAHRRAAEAEQRAQWAYDNSQEYLHEMDLLIAALARVYPSHRMQHSRRRDREAICIHTPAGPLQYLIPDGLVPFLADLPLERNHWDRTKTADRLARLEALAKGLDKP